MNQTGITLKQIGQGFLALLLLIGLVWLTFYVLVLVLIIAAGATIYFLVRRFLMRQGIITPDSASVPADDEPADTNVEVTVIETDYQDLTEEKKRDSD